MNTERTFDGLNDLMNGRYADRIERGNQLLAQLLPRTKEVELEQKGIKVIALQIPSRKNPKLVFLFTRNDKTRRVTCEFGKRRLSTDEGEETLLSLEQLDQKIGEAVHGLIVYTALITLNQTVGLQVRKN